MIYYCTTCEHRYGWWIIYVNTLPDSMDDYCIHLDPDNNIVEMLYDPVLEGYIMDYIDEEWMISGSSE